VQQKDIAMRRGLTGRRRGTEVRRRCRDLGREHRRPIPHGAGRCTVLEQSMQNRRRLDVLGAVDVYG
jgi:hypothetical protein